MALSIGQAVLEIIADAKNVGKEIQSQVSPQLAATAKNAGKAGDLAGVSFGKGLGTGASTGIKGVTNTFAKTLGRGFVGKVSAWGSDAGVGLVRGLGTAVGKGLSKTVQVIGTVLKRGMQGAMISVAAIGAAVITKGFSRLVAIDNATGKLRGLKMSAQDVKTVMDSALASVKGTAFGLGEASTVAASAVAAGIKPGQQLTKYLKTTADAATIAGTSLSDMGSIINQVTTAGHAYTQDLLQLSQRGIPIFQWLAKEYGVTQDKLREMVTAGKVDAATFRKVIADNIGGAALQSGQTVQGAWANVGAAMGRLGEKLLGGAFGRLPKAFADITAVMDNLGPTATSMGDLLGSAFGNIVKYIKPAAGALDAFIKGVSGTKVFGDTGMSAFADTLYKAGGKIRDTFATVQKSMAGVDFSKVLAVFSPLGTILGELLPVLGHMGGLIQDLGKQLGGAIMTALPALFDAVSALLPVVPPLADAFASVLSVLPPLIPILIPVVKLVAELAAGLIKLLSPILESATAMKILTGIFLGFLAVSTVISIINGITAALALNSAALNGSKAAALAYTAVMKIQVFWFKAWSLGMKAAGIATVIFEGILKGLRIVMATSLGPIGLIIGAIALLVAGFIIAYKKSETFRNIVNGALNGIKTVALAVIGWFTGSFLPFFTTTIPNAFRAVMSWVSTTWQAITGYLTRPFVAARDFIVTTLTAIWNAIMVVLVPIGKAFAAIGRAFAAVGKVIWSIWKGYISPVFQLFGAIIVWLVKGYIQVYVAVIKAAFRGLGTAIRWVWTTFIHPALRAWASVFKWLWANVLQPIGKAIRAGFRAIGDGLKWVWSNIISPMLHTYARIFRWLWNSVLQPIGNAIRKGFRAMGDGLQWVWANVIHPVFSKIHTGAVNLRDWLTGIWTKIKNTFHGMGTSLLNSLNNVITPVFGAFRKAAAGMRDAFGRIMTGVRDWWAKLQGWAKKPVEFVINTVINKGLIGTFNKLADFFGTDRMKPINIKMAGGGVLPGYTPGRDVHRFYSPTAGRLDLSGGEAIMRPEFSRAVGGQAGVASLNRAARQGRLGYLGGFREGGLFGGSGRFTPLATKTLLLAQKLSGSNLSIFQRGFRPATSYSGTSHAGDAIDTGPVTGKVVTALRDAGWAAWDRTGKGNWVPHIHAVPLPGAGFAGGSGVWQAKDYLKGGDGLGGRDNGPRGMIDNVLGWLGKGAQGIANAVGGALGSINPVELLNKALAKVMGTAKGVFTGPFGQLITKVPRKMVDKAIEWAKKKLKAMSPFGGAGGTVSGANWSGPSMGGWTTNQLNNAATIINVARQLGFGDRGAIIALMTAMQESTLNNLSGGDRDSVGLFQQRGPWGSFSARTNPAQAARMFFLGGAGGQPGLRSKAWRSMGLGAAAQAVQVSAFPGAYSKWEQRARQLVEAFRDGRRGFDDGGWVPPGLSLAYNGTGKREPAAVFTAEQWSTLTRIANQGEGGLRPGERVVIEIEGHPLTGTVRAVMAQETRRALGRA